MRDSDLVAHCFLCGLGAESLAESLEVDAVLGFSWGFHVRDGEIETAGPRSLGPAARDRHRRYLAGRYPRWSFPPGYADLGAAADAA